jgi:hypothetical protein
MVPFLLHVIERRTAFVYTPFIGLGEVLKIKAVIGCSHLLCFDFLFFINRYT